jgi:hypothetical protein
VSQQARQEDDPMPPSHNARVGFGVGISLFLFYFAFYAGFLFLNVFSPSTMSDNNIPLGKDHVLTLSGVNLAVGYGIALILMGIFLSFLYMRANRSSFVGRKAG